MSSYSYDSANRLTSLTHTQGATTLGSFTYTYDAENRLTQVDL